MDVIVMVRSMTGYGVSTKTLEDAQYTLEIKSVNHRFLDLHIILPSSFHFIEDKIRKIVQQTMERGRVDVMLHLNEKPGNQKELVTDWALLDQYIEQYKLAKERYNLDGFISVDILSSIPDLFHVEEKHDYPVQWADSILQTVTEVVAKVQDMREKEGNYLASDIRTRMNSIHNMLLLIEERRPTVVDDYHQRITERLATYTAHFAEIKSRQFEQDIALLAEKGDIAEELTRLKSHHIHFMDILQESGSKGRKLDFIIQEMVREINTIGSKSIDHLISQWTIQIKSELEKIKEQVQNIE